MGKDKQIDVCIIGSGAGGAVTAYELGSAGFSVVVLEAGPRFSTKDYNTNKTDWETRMNPFVDRAEKKRSYLYTYSDEKLDPSYSHLKSKSSIHGYFNDTENRKPPSIERVKGVGGSTLHYQGEAHRFSPHGFRTKSLYGVADDWPFNYKDLEPYYEKAENILGVAGYSDNPFKPARKPFPNHHHKLSCASQRVKKGFDKTGLHLLPNSLNILSKSRDGRPACNYCNGCYQGCKTRAKGSMDVTFIKMAEETGKVEVRSGSVVREITVNKQGKADGVLYFDSEMVEHRLEAGIVVLSAGALESPRLLLNSKSFLFPDGLANNSGLVGKFFMDSLACITTALFDEQINSYKGLQIDSRAWDDNDTKKGRAFSGGVVYGVTALEFLGPLSYAAFLAPGWGSGHKDFMKKNFGHAINVFAVGEKLPDKNNMIGIDPKIKDHYGIPVAKVTSRLRKNDLEMLSFMAKKCREILEAAGAAEIVREIGSYDMNQHSHISGTCRMGDDPGTSVLNRYCRSHDVSNLFVIDSSCFVTEGGGDSPSLTIHAIALMASEHIISEAKKGSIYS